MPSSFNFEKSDHRMDLGYDSFHVQKDCRCVNKDFSWSLVDGISNHEACLTLRPGGLVRFLGFKVKP